MSVQIASSLIHCPPRVAMAVVAVTRGNGGTCAPPPHSRSHRRHPPARASFPLGGPELGGWRTGKGNDKKFWKNRRQLDSATWSHEQKAVAIGLQRFTITQLVATLHVCW